MKTCSLANLKSAVLGVAWLLGADPPLPAATTNLTATADACLYQYLADNNLGGMTYVVAGVLNNGTACRPLFRFDPAAVLPAGATITSATLTLRVGTVQSTSRTFNVHRVLQSWGEGTGSGSGGGQGAPANSDEVTWNSRFHGSTLWTAPGGLAGTDFVATVSAAAAMGTTNIVFTSPGLAADVQTWLANPGTNFGWLLAIADESVTKTATHVLTREAGADGPVLTIEFTTSTPPAAPVLFAAAWLGDAFRFSFNGQSGHPYVVEYRDSLATTNWGVLTNIPPLTADATLHITNAASASERHFRVRTQ